MKVRISKIELCHKTPLYLALLEGYSDFITLEAEPLTATECLRCKFGCLSAGNGPCQCDCHKPKCNECANDEYTGCTGVLCTKSCPCYKPAEKCCDFCEGQKNECTVPNCECHRKEEKCVCEHFQTASYHAGYEKPISNIWECPKHGHQEKYFNEAVPPKAEEKHTNFDFTPREHTTDGCWCQAAPSLKECTCCPIHKI